MEMNGSNVALLIFALSLWLACGLLPGVIARRRNHRNARGVWGMSILGLFIPVLWLVALIWAIIGEAAPRPVIGTQKQMARRPQGYVGSKRLDYDPDFDDRNADEVLAERLGQVPGKN